MIPTRPLRGLESYATCTECGGTGQRLVDHKSSPPATYVYECWGCEGNGVVLTPEGRRLWNGS
jgi:DnaJ-class molecular chaperone